MKSDLRILIVLFTLNCFCGSRFWLNLLWRWWPVLRFRIHPRSICSHRSSTGFLTPVLCWIEGSSVRNVGFTISWRRYGLSSLHRISRSETQECLNQDMIYCFKSQHSSLTVQNQLIIDIRKFYHRVSIILRSNTSIVGVIEVVGIVIRLQAFYPIIVKTRARSWYRRSDYRMQDTHLFTSFLW